MGESKKKSSLSNDALLFFGAVKNPKYEHKMLR